MTRTHLLLGICTLALAGCAARANPYEAQWQQRKQFYISQMADLHCDKENVGKVLGSCDTVSEEFYKEIADLKKTECDSAHLKKSACGGALFETLMARYRLKYRYADWNQAGTWCTANPKVCDFGTWRGAELFEFELFRTHNRNVHALAMQEKNEIQTQANIDALERQKATMQMWQSIGAGFQNHNQDPINCLSTFDRGSGQYITNCH